MRQDHRGDEASLEGGAAALSGRGPGEIPGPWPGDPEVGEGGRVCPDSGMGESDHRGGI